MCGGRNKKKANLLPPRQDSMITATKVELSRNKSREQGWKVGNEEDEVGNIIGRD